MSVYFQTQQDSIRCGYCFKV